MPANVLHPASKNAATQRINADFFIVFSFQTGLIKIGSVKNLLRGPLNGFATCLNVLTDACNCVAARQKNHGSAYNQYQFFHNMLLIFVLKKMSEYFRTILRAETSCLGSQKTCILIEFPHIDKVSAHCRRRRHGGTDQMRAAVFALTSLKISIGGGGTTF